MNSTQNIKGYELLERIGAGGFGAIYRARQSTVEREVAVKIIQPGLANQPEFIRRFEVEAQLIARLEHMHITPLYDYWRDPEGAYLVMRYLRGGSIRDEIKENAFDLESAARVLDQVASALDFAHRHGVIHRDIKPGNILLDEDGNAYLADFGIAKDIVFEESQTEAGGVVGSLDYISPEQARSEPVTARTDIYSLGVTLYEIISGKHPFEESNTVERLYKHLNDPLPPISSFPNSLSDSVNQIIQQATAKNPESRFQDALSMALAFREAVGETKHDENIVEQLTIREQEVLQMIADGYSNNEIAQELFVTLATVKWHITQLYKKLGVRSRVQAIVRARELNLVISGQTSDIWPLESPVSVSLPEPENPYKGLHAFQTADARDFFGREAVTKKLIDLMKDDHPLSRFIAVVGPSGSGKSSLVKAGLIPALWRGDVKGSERWFVIDMIPGSHPLDELETALIRAAASQVGNLNEQLRRDERGLLRTANIILPADDTELVIVIDQFEELFTLVDDEDERIHFLNLLRTAATDTRSRIRVILTLRADYYDRPLRYPEFGELVRSRMETVLPLGAKDLERAVRGPGERVGVSFEAGLAEQIVSEMTYQPGALPLLQYALTELFDRRSGRLLTHQAYQEIGGAVGALANRADEIFESLTEEAQALTRQMFLRLVTLGEGAEDARRRAPQSEIYSLTENTDLLEEIIDTFASYRLLSLDHDPATRQPTLEVAHEAILREWEQLREWLNDSREDIRQERSLAHAAGEWDGHGRDASYLLRGARLEQAVTWQENTEIVLTPLENNFISRSVENREREEQAAAEQEAKEQALERRSRNALRGLAVVLAVAAIIATGLAIFAFVQRNDAESARDDAEIARIDAENARDEAEDVRDIAEEARENADIARVDAEGARDEADIARVEAEDARIEAEDARSEAEIERLNAVRSAAEFRSVALASGAREALDNGQPDVALALAREAVNIENPPAVSQQVLFDAATTTWIRQRVDGHSERILGAAYGPDGTMAATSGWDNKAILWDVNTGEILDTLEHSDRLFELAFHPQGDLVAIAANNGPVILWNIESDEVNFLESDDGTKITLSFSPDGALLAVGQLDTAATLWDLKTQAQIQTLDGHTGFIRSIAWSPDGERIITGSQDNSAKVWDVATGEELISLVQPGVEPTDDRLVTKVRFLPDNRRALTTHVGGFMHLWDTETGEILRTFERHPDDIYGLDISSDGRLALTSTNQPDATIRLWDIESDQLIRVYEGHTSRVQLVEFSPDEKSMLSASAGGAVLIWDVDPQGLRYALPTPIGGTALSIHPDGDSFIDVGVEGIVNSWSTETGELLRSYEERAGNWTYSLAYSPDGDAIATGDYLTHVPFEENNAYIWDSETGEVKFVLDEHNGYVFDVAFSPDGETLAVAESFGSRIILWDKKTGEVVQILEGHTNEVYEVVFSPDGNTLYSSSRDRTIREWDVETGNAQRVFEGHTNRIWGLDINMDGTQLLSASDDGTLILWDIASGKALKTFRGHNGEVYKARFSPNGKTIISGGKDFTLILWDTESAQPLWRLIGHRQGPWPWVHPEFTPDGSMIMSSTDGGDIISWDVSALPTDLESWVEENRFIPEFTCEQRELYGIEPLCEEEPTSGG